MLTLTTKTATLGIRLDIEDKERLSEYINRESLVNILRQIDSGEIRITSKGVEFMRVNTKVESVNTTVEPISETQEVKNTVIEGVNTSCDNCPYMNDLNMSGFDEVCDFKHIDRQKALDKCVQMLWKG